MFKDFKTFILRGNMMDLAIGIILGGAFGAIIKSLVEDVLMPPIGMLLGNVDFSNLFAVIKAGKTAGPYLTLAEAKAAAEPGEESPAPARPPQTGSGGNAPSKGDGGKSTSRESWTNRILASLPFYRDPSPMAGLSRTARTERIEKALRSNAQFQGMDLQVGEVQGSIYVVGAVPTWPVRRRVERFVRDQGDKVYVDVNKVILTGVYVVQAGDTPRGVAEKLYGDASQASRIMELNHLPAAGGLRAGLKLTLPGTASPASRR